MHDGPQKLIQKYKNVNAITQIQMRKYKYANTITQISNQGRIITKGEYMHEMFTFLFDGHTKWYWSADHVLCSCKLGT